MLKLILRGKKYNTLSRFCSTAKDNSLTDSQTNHSPCVYETVFSFPFVRYIAAFNRLKVYHLTGTSLAVPGCGLMEIFEVLPQGAFLSAAYIGVTGLAVLSVASAPFQNIIGYLYIRADDKKIKISSVDFWGKRKDKIVTVDDWFPLLDMSPKFTDALYLSPQLADGTKYKLFVKYGNVLNSKKMGQVLE
nr:transmembrane protein 186 [Helicoverpa armigera]